MLTPAQYTALKTEIQNDPLTLGYAAQIAIGSDQGVANLLNALTGPGAASVFINNVTVQQLILALQSLSDWDLLTASGATYNSIQLLTLIEPLDCTQTNIQTLLTHVFAGLSAASKTALTAAVKRTGSRAEILFGTGTILVASDVSFAMRGVR